MELALHSVNPFESLDMCPLSDDILPSDEVFLESLIQYDLILDVGSVVTNSNPDFLSKDNIPMDRSSYVGIFDYLDSPFEQQVNDPDEFDFSYEFFKSYDTAFVPVDCISSIDIFFSSEVDLTDF